MLLAPTVHGDERGFFLETFREDVFTELGIPDHFVQDNHSRSRRGIVRGMHFQPGQAKLIRCVRGAILDVLVDIRRGSPQFGQWEGFELDDIEHHQLLLPGRLRPRLLRAQRGRRRDLQDLGLLRPAARGRASPTTIREVGIEWPAGYELVVSERDRTAPTLAERAPSLPF